MNGFVYVTSVLVALEGKLTTRGASPDVLNLLHIVFHTISIAMRFEPANAKFFYHDICLTSLCDTLRLLGCFTTEKSPSIGESNADIPTQKNQDIYHSVFVRGIHNPE